MIITLRNLNSFNFIVFHGDELLGPADYRRCLRLSPPLCPANPRRGESDSEGETPTFPAPATPSTRWATRKKGRAGEFKRWFPAGTGVGAPAAASPPRTGGTRPPDTCQHPPGRGSSRSHSAPPSSSPRSLRRARCDFAAHREDQGQRRPRPAAAERGGGAGSGWPPEPRAVLSRTFQGGLLPFFLVFSRVEWQK